MIQMLVGEAVSEITDNGEELRSAYRGAAGIPDDLALFWRES